MHNKYLIMMTAICLAGLTAHAQLKENIKNLAKDPKTKENAAKADVYIIKRNSPIFDSSKINLPPVKFQGKEVVPPKKKL